MPAKHYVQTGPAPTAERARSTPGFTVHDWPDLDPERLVELLTKV
ncbi:hypothetical protein ACI797_20110 [Geodermatophilus sp. SYSU D00691]